MPVISGLTLLQEGFQNIRNMWKTCENIERKGITKYTRNKDENTWKTVNFLRTLSPSSHTQIFTEETIYIRYYQTSVVQCAMRTTHRDVDSKIPYIAYFFWRHDDDDYYINRTNLVAGYFHPRLLWFLWKIIQTRIVCRLTWLVCFRLFVIR